MGVEEFQAGQIAAKQLFFPANFLSPFLPLLTFTLAFIDDPDEVGTQEGVMADAAGNVYGSLTGAMTLRKYSKKW